MDDPELLKAHNPSASTVEKLMLPEFGNYVAHEQVFGKRLDRVYPAAAVWHCGLIIYDATCHGSATDRLAGRGQPSQIAGPEFDDFAAPYWIDEASTSPLLGECEKDRRIDDLAEVEAQGAQRVGGRFRARRRQGDECNHLYLSARAGASADGGGTAPVFRFLRKGKGRAGHIIAANSMLTAVLIQPEVLFRQELGDGPMSTTGCGFRSGKSPTLSRMPSTISRVPNSSVRI